MIDEFSTLPEHFPRSPGNLHGDYRGSKSSNLMGKLSNFSFPSFASFQITYFYFAFILQNFSIISIITFCQSFDLEQIPLFRLAGCWLAVEDCQ